MKIRAANPKKFWMGFGTAIGAFIAVNLLSFLLRSDVLPAKDGAREWGFPWTYYKHSAFHGVTVNEASLWKDVGLAFGLSYMAGSIISRRRA